jgi:hypothetical protein
LRNVRAAGFQPGGFSRWDPQISLDDLFTSSDEWIEEEIRMEQTTEITKSNLAAIDEDAELGYGAILVGESEDRTYEAVTMVSTIREARELAAENFRNRVNDVSKGRDRMLPIRYVIWQRGMEGTYRVTNAFERS